MAQVLVRELDDDVVERLKIRAAGNERSLEAKLRVILSAAAAQLDMATARSEAAEMRRGQSGRIFPDAGGILAEDRGR